MGTANSKQQTANDSRQALGDPFDAAYTFRKLAMWQRAQELTNQVIDIVSKLPDSRPTRIIADQLVRSASSIAANIAEGHGRFVAVAYRNHLSIARGSTAETISWLDLLVRRQLISAEIQRTALSKCAELMRMLTANMAEMDRKLGAPKRFAEERAEYQYD